MPREQPSDTAFAEGTPGFAGRVQLSYDDETWQDETWQDDLQTTYRRVSPSELNADARESSPRAALFAATSNARLPDAALAPVQDLPAVIV